MLFMEMGDILSSGGRASNPTDVIIKSEQRPEARGDRTANKLLKLINKLHATGLHLE